jgi:hypothetical protein
MDGSVVTYGVIHANDISYAFRYRPRLNFRVARVEHDAYDLPGETLKERCYRRRLNWTRSSKLVFKAEFTAFSAVTGEVDDVWFNFKEGLNDITRPDSVTFKELYFVSMFRSPQIFADDTHLFA